MHPTRLATLEAVARHVPDPQVVGRPVRVGIDGRDGSGKTWFADELADLLRGQGREVVGVSIDGFHRSRAERYARGRRSPEGFYLDSYDYDRFHADVLQPFGPGGDRRYRAAAHDVATDVDLEVETRTASPCAILLVDGIFLHRDELHAHWDFSVYLHVPVEVAAARMAVRDGGSPDPGDAHNRRYVRGQELYHRACSPTSRASIVVDNTNLDAPGVIAPVGQLPTT